MAAKAAVVDTAASEEGVGMPDRPSPRVTSARHQGALGVYGCQHCFVRLGATGPCAPNANIATQCATERASLSLAASSLVQMRGAGGDGPGVVRCGGTQAWCRRYTCRRARAWKAVLRCVKRSAPASGTMHAYAYASSASRDGHAPLFTLAPVGGPLFEFVVAAGWCSPAHDVRALAPPHAPPRRSCPLPLALW